MGFLVKSSDNATVVLNAEDYNTKVNVLKTGKYILLNKDPTKVWSVKLRGH